MEQARSSPVATSAGDADDSAPAVTTRIGRLFSSPEQRIELDRLRNDPGSGRDAASEQVEAPAIPRNGIAKRPRQPSPFAATFNGIVVRNDGHLVAWVDGVETAAGATTPAGLRIETDHTPDGRFRIRLSNDRTSAVLKPGQAIAMDGTVRDAYERRSTRVPAGTLGERMVDSGGGAEGEGAAAPIEEPEAVSPPILPANLVQELLRGMRAGPAPLGMGASGARPAGDG